MGARVRALFFLIFWIPLLRRLFPPYDFTLLPDDFWSSPSKFFKRSLEKRISSGRTLGRHFCRIILFLPVFVVAMHALSLSRFVKFRATVFFFSDSRWQPVDRFANLCCTGRNPKLLAIGHRLGRCAAFNFEGGWRYTEYDGIVFRDFLGA